MEVDPGGGRTQGCAALHRRVLHDEHSFGTTGGPAPPRLPRPHPLHPLDPQGHHARLKHMELYVF